MGNMCGIHMEECLQVVVLGLDGAGKTSAVRWLSNSLNKSYYGWMWTLASDDVDPPPTGIRMPEGGVKYNARSGVPVVDGASADYINVEVLPYRGKQFVFLDLGGKEEFRETWKDFVTPRTFAIVYVVDSGCPERLSEARDVLFRVVRSLVPTPDTPLILLNHKTDKVGSLTRSKLISALKMDTLKNVLHWRLFNSSVKRKEGVPVEMLDYLAEMHQHRRMGHAESLPVPPYSEGRLIGQKLCDNIKKLPTPVAPVAKGSSKRRPKRSRQGTGNESEDTPSLCSTTPALS